MFLETFCPNFINYLSQIIFVAQNLNEKWYMMKEMKNRRYFKK